jgi:peptidyl-prolyl cis-trans isomerase C
MKIKVRHILVPFEHEIKDIDRKLKHNESTFEELARIFSQCPSHADQGDLGEISLGRTVQEFEEMAFSLDVGQTSRPVKTKFGWHLIKRYA